MIGATCIICGATAGLLFTAKDYNRKITGESFNYHRCGQCGLVFLHPAPRDLGNYYPHDYYNYSLTIADVSKKARAERFKLDIVRRFKRGGRLLEIGANNGNFAYLAKAAGFVVDAVEHDAACCGFLDGTLGVRAINSPDVAAAVKGLGAYDVIAMWHVVEHLPALPQTLAALAGELAPGGVMVIATPNPDSFQFSKNMQYWVHLDAPRHLQLIPKATLDGMLKPLGLAPVWSTTRDPNTRHCNKSGWKESFGHPYREGFKKKVMRKVGRYIAAALWPYEALAEGAGSAYNAVYIKR